MCFHRCGRKHNKRIVFSCFFRMGVRLGRRVGATTSRRSATTSMGPTPTCQGPASQQGEICSSKGQPQLSISPQRCIKVRKASGESPPKGGLATFIFEPRCRGSFRTLAFYPHETNMFVCYHRQMWTYTFDMFVRTQRSDLSPLHRC